MVVGARIVMVMTTGAIGRGLELTVQMVAKVSVVTELRERERAVRIVRCAKRRDFRVISFACQAHRALVLGALLFL